MGLSLGRGRHRALLVSSVAAVLLLTQLPGLALAAYPTTPCYEDQSMATPGWLRAYGSGSGYFADAQSGDADNPPATERGGGTIEWRFKARVLGPNSNDADGDIRGFLNATITWDDTGLGVTVFKSACVSEVRGDRSTFEEGPTGRLEAKYEGVVWNYPGTTEGGQAAMAEVHMARTSGIAVITLSIELGTDCFAPDPDDETNLAEATGGSLTASGHGGRESWPASAGGPDGC